METKSSPDQKDDPVAAKRIRDEILLFVVAGKVYVMCDGFNGDGMDPPSHVLIGSDTTSNLLSSVCMSFRDTLKF